jgi:hypothetical protein
MRSVERWLTPALTASLLLAAAAVAQPPDPNQGPAPDLVRPAPVSVDDIVERIMAFDKNKDGKVSKDELPERMQFLIELGDADKDGALDRDEIRKLVSSRATTPGVFPVGGFRTSFGPGPGPGPGAIEGVVDDLKLSGKKKDQAMAVVKAHEENVRKAMEQARAELLEKMKEILNEEELQDFKAALDRPRGATVFVGPRDAPRPGDVETRIGPPR